MGDIKINFQPHSLKEVKIKEFTFSLIILQICTAQCFSLTWPSIVEGDCMAQVKLCSHDRQAARKILLRGYINIAYHVLI